MPDHGLALGAAVVVGELLKNEQFLAMAKDVNWSEVRRILDAGTGAPCSALTPEQWANGMAELFGGKVDD